MKKTTESYPRIIIAGLKGGSGKTTLTLGLIASWKGKGHNVVSFKKGPDYIDGGWLSTASGNPCYNLDTFLIGERHIIPSFIKHAESADIAVIEGNRGIYDGMDEKGTHSTAELAKMLKSPVILIVDCTKATRTISAIVSGIQKFDPSVDIRGVVLNFIAGSRHESVIKKSIETYCSIPVLGAFPKLREENLPTGQAGLPERHMGLVPFQEHIGAQKAVNAAAEVTGKYVDIDAVWKIANEAPVIEISSDVLIPEAKKTKNVKIGIIKDSAFQFYYQENIEELEAKGAEIKVISALKERTLPDIDALYIGGGFPETHAIALAENTDFRNSLRSAIEKGLPVYAECGGLMYLGESLIMNEKSYPMAGIFPLKFILEKKPQAHGYSIVEVKDDNPYYSKDSEIRGHEFHYSRVVNPEVISELISREISFAFQMKRGEGIVNKLDGICYKNVLATYTHIHALGTTEWVEGIIKRALKYKKNRS